MVYPKPFLAYEAKPAFKWTCTCCGAKILYSVPGSRPSYLCSCGNYSWKSAARKIFSRAYF